MLVVDDDWFSDIDRAILDLDIYVILAVSLIDES